MGGSLHRWRFGNAEFDEARFELRVDGRAVALQPRPLQLLARLLATPGEVVSKDELLADLWGGEPSTDAVLTHAASKLRAALGPAHAAAIVTVPRRGYRFAGTVERMAAGRRQAATTALEPGLPVPGRNGYRLVRRLAPASRHETWLAEQPRTGDRRVFKFALDGERLAALKREVTVARVLHRALGERDDIVRVLDCQFDEAPFWLESAWAGDSLDDWAATHLHAQTLQQRVELALQVADALAAAHAVPVVHRDLKPANVLVAPRADRAPGWQLRLADFGSARLPDPGVLDRLRVTRLGLTVDGDDATSGTPYYIAPELLAGGRTSPVADVYALGVMLYQLLAGDLRRPLAPGWERGIDDALLREDIAAATDIDPTRRLPAAALLAERLRRLPERRAAAQALAAEEALQRLEAVEALNRLLREDLIGAANPALQGRADITVAEALTGAAARIDDKYASLPDGVRGGLHAAMQQALGELSRAQEAVQAGRRAVQALAAAGLQQELQEARLRLALDLVQVSRLDEAAEVLGVLRAEAGPPQAQAPLFRARLLFVQSWLTGGDLSIDASLAQLQEAAVLLDQVPPETPARSTILFSLADNLAMVGRHAEAEALYRRLLAEQQQRHGDAHPRPNYTRVGLANALARQGRHDEARALLEPAAECLAQTMGPGHRQTLAALDMLADVRLRQQDWAGAAADWARVHAGYVALLGEGSSYAITVQTNRAIALHRGGDAPAARPLLESALGHARAFLPDDAPQVQQIRFALAECLHDLGDDSAAALLHGLQPESLNVAQPEDDWPRRLATLRAAMQPGG